MGSIIAKTTGKNVITEKDNIKHTSALINLHPDKTLGWHIQNLSEQNIPIKYNKINNKKIVYDKKQSKYPNDVFFLSNIQNIMITFDE